MLVFLNASLFCFFFTLYQMYGYYFTHIVSTNIFFLDHSTKLDNRMWASKTIEEGSSKFIEAQTEIKIKICVCDSQYEPCLDIGEATYTMKNFLTEKSRLLKSVHPLYEWVCYRLRKKLALPGFGDTTYCGINIQLQVRQPMLVSIARASKKI